MATEQRSTELLTDFELIAKFCASVEIIEAEPHQKTDDILESMNVSIQTMKFAPNKALNELMAIVLKVSAEHESPATFLQEIRDERMVVASNSIRNSLQGLLKSQNDREQLMEFEMFLKLQAVIDNILADRNERAPVIRELLEKEFVPRLKVPEATKSLLSVTVENIYAWADPDLTAAGYLARIAGHLNAKVDETRRSVAMALQQPSQSSQSSQPSQAH